MNSTTFQADEVCFEALGDGFVRNDKRLGKILWTEDVSNGSEVRAFWGFISTDGVAGIAGTNGLVYQQIILPLPALTDQQLDLLPIYSNCLTELGVDQDARSALAASLIIEQPELAMGR